MLTLKNDLTDSSYARSDPYVSLYYFLLHQRLMTNICDIMGVHML